MTNKGIHTTNIVGAWVEVGADYDYWHDESDQDQTLYLVKMRSMEKVCLDEQVQEMLQYNYCHIVAKAAINFPNFKKGEE